MSEAPPPVLFERLDAHVVLVTLNRPEKRNAVNPELASALEAIVRQVENEPDVRVVLLASSHDRVFCAGADLAAVSAGKGVGIYAIAAQSMLRFRCCRANLRLRLVSCGGGLKATIVDTLSPGMIFTSYAERISAGQWRPLAGDFYLARKINGLRRGAGARR